jgi:hypothetical protein
LFNHSFIECFFCEFFLLIKPSDIIKIFLQCVVEALPLLCKTLRLEK